MFLTIMYNNVRLVYKNAIELKPCKREVKSEELFTLLTHGCAAMHSSNKNDESAYREEVQRLTAWCKANNLSRNVEKMKEMVVDFRKAQSDHSPLNINESNMEIIKSTKFLGVHLAEDLT
ncbi:hypothetical protein QTP70_025427 [Hemibagrus guttatus]|uniref:Uncharacterized protein n=1 Tax=Hemibagrus guttatus TaxID=175788 RepID=A0AAE0V028_9TELE|nr:hypothetical protein QTP70_025427 [Hemibagrus guttatus]